VPSRRGPRRRAPRAHGNDLRAPGDDSPPGPPPTTRRQTCIGVLCAYLRMPCEPDPGDLSTPAERHAGAPDRTGVLIVSWTCGGLPAGAIRGVRERLRVGAGAGDRVLVAVRVPPGAGHAHAGPRGIWWCTARRGAAWRPGTHRGTSRRTAFGPGLLPRHATRWPCQPQVAPVFSGEEQWGHLRVLRPHAASWRPCMSLTVSKATRSRRSEFVAAPPESVPACFKRPGSVSRCQPLRSSRIRWPGWRW
jgi:hypothetical protein